MSEGRKAKSVFDFIAPIYGLFYSSQKKHYNKMLDALKPELDLSIYNKVLDVGCGTGALCAVLHKRGHDVAGIDPARKMLDVAVRKPENREIRFMEGDILKGLPFEEKSFDISMASYVAHGMKEEDRRVMYAEMSRVSRNLVIFYDYNENRSIFTDFVEWMEGGDYFNFIQNAAKEMRGYFDEVRLVEATPRGRWYICTPSGVSAE